MSGLDETTRFIRGWSCWLTGWGERRKTQPMRLTFTPLQAPTNITSIIKPNHQNPTPTTTNGNHPHFLWRREKRGKLYFSYKRCDQCKGEFRFPDQSRKDVWGRLYSILGCYDIPFKCQHCGGLFCAAHRLPENHNCIHRFDDKRLISSSTISILLYKLFDVRTLFPLPIRLESQLIF